MIVDLEKLLDGPPRHLERFAPPWATGDRVTICGRPLDDVAGWVSFEDGRRLVARLGRTRAQLVFCQTCLSRQGAIQRASAWRQNPLDVVHDYTRHYWDQDAPVFEQIRAELLAIAQLVDRHREEYTAAVIAFQTDELAARRRRG